MPTLTKNELLGVRNSRMFLNEVYFWTDTVHNWKRLFKPDAYKLVLIEYLQKLVRTRMAVIYGYVIMPNHLHLIWELLAKNGKEMPHASFNKHTSHELVKELRLHHPQVLTYFVVEEAERQHRIWQRDPLAIRMDSRAKVEQKLTYIHLNPLHERWNLAEQPENYRWSSARFYETGEDEFGLLTHYRDRF
jgi:REP element-mobilizing transposase RayT